MSSLSIILALWFNANSVLSVYPPIIRPRCNLGEQSNPDLYDPLGFCIDVFGVFPSNFNWDIMIVHSCKPGLGPSPAISNLGFWK